MEKLEIGRFYFLKILFYGRELEYNCKVDFIDKKSIKIFTEEGNCLEFDLDMIVHFHELEDFELDPRIVINKKRVKFKDLRKEKGPDF